MINSSLFGVNSKHLSYIVIFVWLLNARFWGETHSGSVQVSMQCFSWYWTVLYLTFFLIFPGDFTFYFRRLICQRPWRCPEFSRKAREHSKIICGKLPDYLWKALRLLVLNHHLLNLQDRIIQAKSGWIDRGWCQETNPDHHEKVDYKVNQYSRSEVKQKL